MEREIIILRPEPGIAEGRMYKGKRFIIELKIWRGNEYNTRGEQQLFEYLEFYKMEKGYLLSFNFNKSKKTGIREISYEGKRILEVVV